MREHAGATMTPRSAGVSPATTQDAGEAPGLRERWAGLVLAGGRSTRFGGEKAIALLHGRPLMGWCVDALGGVCAEVVINARRSSEAEALAHAVELEVIYDDPAHPAGPLAGVAAGFKWARARGFDGLVTLPCDTPLVGAAELNQLIAALKEGGRPVRPPAAYAVAAGRAQGLCAAWWIDLARPLNARLAGGEHPAVHRWLDEIGATGAVFADDAPFRNINTRADLARLAAPF